MRKTVCLLILLLLISTGFLSFPIGGGGSVSNTAMAEEKDCKTAIEEMREIMEWSEKEKERLTKKFRDDLKAIGIKDSSRFRKVFKKTWQETLKRAARKGATRVLIFVRIIGTIGLAMDLYDIMVFLDNFGENLMEEDLVDAGFTREQAEWLAEQYSDMYAQAAIGPGGKLMQAMNQLEKFLERRPMCTINPPGTNPKPPPLPIKISSGLGRKENGGREPSLFDVACVTTPGKDGKPETECRFYPRQ